MAEGPIPPICDLECQKQKQLSSLKMAKDTMDKAYLQASEGHGAISSQKESKAKDEAEKTIRNYTQQYELLKTPSKKKPSQDVAELTNEIEKEKSQTDVLNRLSQFSELFSSSTDWIGIMIDVMIAILGLVFVYLLYSRLFSYSTDVVVESSDVTI